MVAVAEAGVDTWSPSWYVDPDGRQARLLDELATAGTRRGTLVPGRIAGHRWGWIRETGFLYAEGHPRQGGLAGGERLLMAFDELREGMAECGVDLAGEGARWGSPLLRTDDGEGFAGVRRCDATVDLRTTTRAEGLAVLAGAWAVACAAGGGVAEAYVSADGSGAVETVYLRGSAGKRVLGRWYDKGVESGRRDERGRRIRIEDQRRWPRGLRRDVGELTGAYLRGKFQDRFLPMWRATKGVMAVGGDGVSERLAELSRLGAIRCGEAERLAGYAALRKHGFEQPRTTAYRRRRQLLELGLVQADGVVEEVEVDLHEVLERALDAGAWNRQG